MHLSLSFDAATVAIIKQDGVSVANVGDSQVKSEPCPTAKLPACFFCTESFADERRGASILVLQADNSIAHAKAENNSTRRTLCVC